MRGFRPGPGDGHCWAICLSSPICLIKPLHSLPRDTGPFLGSAWGSRGRWFSAALTPPGRFSSPTTSSLLTALLSSSTPLCSLAPRMALSLAAMTPGERVASSACSTSSLPSACTSSSSCGSKCMGQMSSRLMMRLAYSRATVQVGGENLQQLVKELEQELSPIMGDLIPSLSMLDFFSKQRMRRIHARLDKVFTQMLMERKESTSLHDDLLQSLLSQQEAFTVVEIKAILSDIIAAGIHTTALSLEWAMAELLKNPRCLHQLQREIDMKVGEKKEVSEADLPNLTYLKCIVKEVFRLHPAAPLLLPRISMEECKLQGYLIPEKTFMFVNAWAIGRDERVWPNANEFMPERFEGKDVDLKGQHFELLPFGSGRRSCLGLPLALRVVEITLANLVSCFDWELPYGETHTSINMDEKRGLTANKATPVMAIPKSRVSFSQLPNV